MQGHLQETNIYRILCGKTILNINKSRLEVITPSLDLIYESCILYKEYFEKTKIISKDELREYLINKGIISRKELDFLSKCTKIIEDFQKDLYTHFDNTSTFNALKSYINKTRLEESNIYWKLSKYETYTKEGLANYAKSLFLIRNTVYSNNKKYKFKTIKHERILNELNLINIGPKEIRDLSKNGQWMNMWYALKDYNLFPEGIGISIEKQLLLMWSKIYDNIRESTECPKEEIVNDNDAIDGWLLIQKENKKVEKTDKQYNSKLGNAQDIFIIAKNKEEIDRINNMNSQYSKQLRDSRLNQIYQHGLISHGKLADVKQDLMMQQVQMGVKRG